MTIIRSMLRASLHGGAPDCVRLGGRWSRNCEKGDEPTHTSCQSTIFANARYPVSLTCGQAGALVHVTATAKQNGMPEDLDCLRMFDCSHSLEANLDRARIVLP